MKKTWKAKLIACFTAAALLVPQSLSGTGTWWSKEAKAETKLTEEEANSLYQEVSYKRQSVHDPSIVKDGNQYYVFGTHLAVAKTTDLKNWSEASISGENLNSSYFGTRDSSGKVTKTSYNNAFKSGAYGKKTIKTADGSNVEVDFSTFAAEDWICSTKTKNADGSTTQWTVQGNMWAPDIIYNKQMKKWCLYLSLNGDVWNSVIVLLTSDDIEGPYVYEAPIVYTGFTAKGVNSYEMTDVSLAINNGKKLSSLPKRYDNLITNVAEDGTETGNPFNNAYGNYWTNAIDPCVFYDSDGNLWMSYGSWSGGIWMIELDETTGLRDYSVKYEYQINGTKANENTQDKNVTSDPYFGKKIAGGNWVSGEGSYIQKIGSYYYLCVSYGELQATGGYNIRVFRSEYPDGPYVDETGASAIYTSYMNNYREDSKGLQLMGNYQWDSMSSAQVAQGHNSLLADEDGNNYVVYHTRFDDGTQNYQMRVHQIYQTENGWLVAAPYEYAGEKVNDNDIKKTEIEKSKIVGDYDLIIHQYSNPKANGSGTVSNNLDVVKPVNITLNADGSISGSYTGVWTEKQGTAYASITIGGKLYRGVFAEQTIEGTNVKTMCFTAASSTGNCIWGSKVPDDKTSVAANVNALSVTISEKTYLDLELPADALYGASVQWISSNTSVIDQNGHVTLPTEDTKVNLTLKIIKGDCTYEKTYTTTVAGSSSNSADITGGLEASYNFNNDFTNSIDKTQSGTPKALSSGTAPVREYNSERKSYVAHQYFGYDDANSTSFIQFPNPLKGKALSGATISLWVNRQESFADIDAVWGFWDQDNSDGINGKFYLTPNTYLGFNGTGGWFDCNHTDGGLLSDMGLKQWKLVTVTIDKDGFDIYIDGKGIYSETKYNSFNKGNGFSGNYQSVLNLLQSSPDFYLGYGSWWGSAPLLTDNLKIYSRALSETDVAKLYTEETAGNADNLTATEYQEKTKEPEASTDQVQDTETVSGSETTGDTQGSEAAENTPDAETTEETEDEDDTQTQVSKKTKKTALNKKKITLKKGNSVQLKLKNAKKKVTWKSSNTNVAKVNKKGKVTAKKKGNAVIRAVCAKKTYKCKVTVK